MTESNANKSQRIATVGIGASAGGIEALQTFFASVRPDLGLAYVVVVHLAPDRESELPHILSRHTRMPVTQVGDHDKAELEPDHVYVIAPDRKLEITDASVGASRFEQPRGFRPTIDLFFRSLAATHGDGFAIILSGSGSDGAVGAKAVKESGGVVLVQDPGEAAYGDMPRATIATGAADVVLPVEQLAARLAELAHNKRHVVALLQPLEKPAAVSGHDELSLRRLLEVIHSRSGHDFSKYKRSTLLRRIARRMQLSHQTSLAEYLDQVVGSAEESRSLLDDLLITVTSFFRDPDAWASLQARVVRRLVERCRPDDQLRVWVPGCATGEEAYSMAMLFHEEFDRQHLHRSLVIFATDIDEGALGAAREGRFAGAIRADVSAARLERFFSAEDDHYRANRELRDTIVFALHNLLRDPPFSRLHLISCRNLLIYLEREMQEEVLRVLRYACLDGGYLFLGASESVDDQLFSTVDKKHRIFVTTPGAHALLPNLLKTPPLGSQRKELGSQTPIRQLASEIHLEALEEVAPPSVIVDEHWNVLHVSSSAARFFQQNAGVLARKLTDLVRPELRDEVHATLHRAFERDEPHLSQFASVAFNGMKRRVGVLAQQRPRRKEGSPQALVTFLDAGEAISLEPGSAEPPNDLVRSLREQLRRSEGQIDQIREDHYSTTEDLRAANEELQSLNEEYRSTTEELETSKEELQSINEELQTVNLELKLKLEEVSRGHNDIENLMAATDIGILFLDRDLLINRFTPPVAEIFNVKGRDLGRPIADVSHRLDYQGLASDATEVIRTGRPIEREAHGHRGKDFIVRLNPYRIEGSADPEGVIVTFIDVTDAKRSETFRREAEAELAKELDQSRRLHELAMSAALVGNMRDALGSILVAAIETLGADFGNIQIVDPQTQRLELVAQHGFGASFVEKFETVDSSEETACARALRTRKVCSIDDVTLDPGYAPYRDAAGEAGYRSVQSVPLLDRAGAPVGVLSAHFREPHRLTERDEQMGDLLARQAADVIVIRTQQDTLTQLNEALRKRTQELADEGRNREEFLAALGHELRNPMAAIASAIEIVKATDEPTRRAVAILRRQSQHMIRLLNDLLDVSRISRGKITLHRKVTDLTRCAREAAENLRKQIEDKGLELEVDLAAESLPIDGDGDRLAQIFDNLLRNAMSYTEAGRITVTTHREAGFARASVRDTGVGIDPQEADRIFQSYHQSERAKRTGGLGLGLTLAKRLVELHGGSITLHSGGAGAGSEFTFSLPLVHSLPETAAAETAPELPRRRVLVVDDQPDVADSFAAVLEHLGQDVRVAYGGEAALEAAREDRPAVAFVDLSMPGMDGYEVARRLRRELPASELTLVALTGHGVASSAEADFAHRLLKPATPDQIAALLMSLGDRAGSDR